METISTDRRNNKRESENMKSEYKTTECIYCGEQKLRMMQTNDWESTKRNKTTSGGRDGQKRMGLTYNQKEYDYYVCDACWRISMCSKGMRIE